ncbi:MAG TPA: acetyl-CoA C-acetyltransferase [Candidatus Hydrogenedentes bacterium]|nr:acetyl-CoA C-acetyltransferase [Candidatus Hydrogenedentota bacterium]HOV76173.1 acetyl-CoA C-acetyltransferase [Candidatus Hydrogenedentota bacterium]HPC18423.1 acetyl-CoA C-acetyltransferase [Candidatus Hydrogenedentota bacterium]HRT22173.1 acetyl-CoA C-acetyltransferase [Candidatus Hydrogenedentota bacterium]HRT66916.1 acetyl-CoA C-acetyltransferase [Candidatus Hydrogenedentota bacterium]
MREVYAVSAVRTAIGTFGGGLRDYPAPDLMALVVKESLRRANVAGDQVGDVIVGQCMQRMDEVVTGRLAALKAGLPITVPGVTIHRNCSSAMQAVVYGAQQIMLGDLDVVVAGGVEVMSRTPYCLYQARWGARLQHGVMSDAIWDGLTDSYTGLIMGLTAENLAEKYNISRQEQDEVAMRSHNNAEAAIKSGRVKDEIMPVEIPAKKGAPVVFDTDEHVRMGMTMDQLARLKPGFKKDGTVTAGNASGINDGSSAMVLMSGDKVRELGVKPIAKLRGYGLAGVEPELMGYGPVPATRQVLERTGLKLADIELIELNEAFAAQYIACEKLLGLNRDITNVNGSGIALGHPVGSTGCKIIVSLLHEMKRRGNTLGLATLCVGGGMGMATIWEMV